MPKPARRGNIPGPDRTQSERAPHLRYVDLGKRAGAPAAQGDYADGAERKKAEAAGLGCSDDFPRSEKAGVGPRAAGVRAGTGKGRALVRRGQDDRVGAGRLERVLEDDMQI